MHIAQIFLLVQKPTYMHHSSVFVPQVGTRDPVGDYRKLISKRTVENFEEGKVMSYQQLQYL